MKQRRRYLIGLISMACMTVPGRAGPLAQEPPGTGTIPRCVFDGSGNADAGAARDGAGIAVVDLSGLWEGTFMLDSAWQLPERASSRTVRARIQFSPVGDATPATSSSRSVHGGTFEIDFSRFGFTLATQQALGWSTSPDSLRAVLNPTVDHGLVELSGQISGGVAAVGTWRYASDPGGARGTFRLQRVRTRTG